MGFVMLSRIQEINQLFTINCQSLRLELEHIIKDPVVKQSDVIICPNGTWLKSYETHANIQI